LRQVYYTSRHQIACFRATEGLHSLPYRAAVSHQYSVAGFATLRVLSCIHSPGLHYSFYNDVRHCCDLEVCNLVTTVIELRDSISVKRSRLQIDYQIHVVQWLPVRWRKRLVLKYEHRMKTNTCIKLLDQYALSRSLNAAVNFWLMSSWFLWSVASVKNLPHFGSRTQTLSRL
jgi:hypothetical protein